MITIRMSNSLDLDQAQRNACGLILISCDGNLACCKYVGLYVDIDRKASMPAIILYCQGAMFYPSRHD